MTEVAHRRELVHTRGAGLASLLATGGQVWPVCWRQESRSRQCASDPPTANLSCRCCTRTERKRFENQQFLAVVPSSRRIRVPPTIPRSKAAVGRADGVFARRNLAVRCRGTQRNARSHCDASRPAMLFALISSSAGRHSGLGKRSGSGDSDLMGSEFYVERALDCFGGVKCHGLLLISVRAVTERCVC